MIDSQSLLADRRPTSDLENRRRALGTMSGLPLMFEENQGQFETNASLVAHGHGAMVGFESSSIRLGLVGAEETDGTRDGVCVLFLFAGASDCTPRGDRRLPGVHNYLRGSDPAKWRVNVPLFEQVRYEDLYPGVCVVIGERSGRLEYDLHLANAACLDAVRVECDGIEAIEIGESGDLAMQTIAGTIRQSPPKSWYVAADGAERPADCHFKILGPTAYGFEVENPEADRKLIVDPGLMWSTFLGGSSDDAIFGVDYATGLVTVVGGTTSLPTTFPVTTGAYQTLKAGGEDAFVTRFNPSLSGAAQLIWSTYLGGSGDDEARGVSVASNGDVSLCGWTKSSNFPVTANASQSAPLGSAGQTNAFVARILSTGATLNYGTYYGGNLGTGTFTSQPTSANALALDSGGTITVVGRTEVIDLTLVNAYDTTYGGSGDAWAAQFNPGIVGSSTLIYSTYVGGTASGYDEAFSVDVDSGNIYLGGSTLSTDLTTTTTPLPVALQPAALGSLDGFLVEINPSLPAASQLRYATYIGSPRDDEIFGVVINKGKGVINCCGYTKATTGSFGGSTADFPISNTSQPSYSFFGGDADGFQTAPGFGGQDAFLIRLDPANATQQLRYGAFLGGNGADQANALAVVTDTCDVVVGWTQRPTNSNSFPWTPGAFDTTWTNSPTGDTQAFLTRLNWKNNKAPSAQLDYSTFLGGDLNIDMATCLVLNAGEAYVGGFTMASDFPTAGNPFDATWNGPSSGYRGDGFICQFTLPSLP